MSRELVRLIVFVAVFSSGCGGAVTQAAVRTHTATYSQARADAAVNPPNATPPYDLALYCAGIDDDVDPGPPLMAIGDVVSVLRIPQEFFRSDEEEPVGPMIEGLRAHAADNGANLLLVMDFREDWTLDINGWYALSPLLFPLFTTPWLTEDVEGALDWYLIDVATGAYLARGHQSTEPTSRDIMIYETADEGRRMHQSVLVEHAVHDVSLLLTAWHRARTVPAPIIAVPVEMPAEAPVEAPGPS